MCVITALVDFGTLLEPAFNDILILCLIPLFIFLFECVINLFSICHNT